jgi:dTDP-4-dehydrorhamnose reductase
MRVLVTGASGQLGGYLLRELAARKVEIVAWSGSRRGSLFGVDLRPVDLADRDAVATAFRQACADTVIHAGALGRVADCFRDPETARLINTQGSASLAELAGRAGARLLHVSTDHVFDGERGNYCEEDVATPHTVYGRTKADAEQAVQATPQSLVVRVSLFFGPSVVGRPTFFDEQVNAARTGKPVALFMDEWRTPLSLRTAASALVALAHAEHVGIVHLGGPERMSRLEMGQRLAAYLGLEASFIRPIHRADAPCEEPRPRDASLDSSRWRALYPKHSWPTWEAALGEFTDLTQ